MPLQIKLAPSGMAQLVECHPAKLKVAGWIPAGAHARVVGPVPCWGMCKKQPIRCVSHTSMILSFSPPSPLSKNK